ncbi:MAG: DUF47 family protein [Candidatus Bipolaricaulota bacterium]
MDIVWLFRLWRRASLAALREHAGSVENAAEELGKQLRAWLRNEAVNAELVSEREHAADMAKREVRIQLTEGGRLPVSRSALFQFVWYQDEIADLCQDAALLMALRRPEMDVELEDGFRALGEAVLRAVHAHHLAVEELDQLFRRGITLEMRKRVVENVDRINQLEHESDLRERELVATIYASELLGDFNR